MAQPLITQFYNKRKRAAEGCVTDFKSKVLILDGENKLSHSEDSSRVQELECSYGSKKVAYSVTVEENTNVMVCKSPATVTDNQAQADSRQSPSVGSTKVCKKLPIKTARNKVPLKTTGDIRLAFKPKGLNTTNAPNTEISEGKNDCVKEQVSGDNGSELEKRVVFELLGGLSPKKNSKDKATPIKQNSVDQNNVAVKNARRELGLMTPKKVIEERTKAVRVDGIQRKLNRSARLAEIRESIKKFNTSDQALQELEIRRKNLECTSPRLQKFTAIDLEVPISPQKGSSAAASPIKASPLKKTPIKSPLTSPVKSPAFQRLAHLVQTGVPSLTLPYSYRFLEEIFRCVDTVTSMMYNRRETVTFDKLKSGVQQMLRRNFSEQHIGQIKRVFPDAFNVSQEKSSMIMSSKKVNKYQLVVVPIFDPKVADVLKMSNGSCHSVMTPTLLVQRREQFHNNLLKIVKNHHKKFLENLDPPVIIPHASLARWHPEFQLDAVPPITPAELPAPPCEEKICSAKEVLDRAKTLFGCNERMEKALQMVSEQIKKSEETSSSEVRAKQAAKALLAMTRTPAEDREAIQLLRLPEIARILRNIFVAEKKSVLHLEVTLQKLANSYREAISNGELEQHIRLLMKVVPGWVDIMHIRKTDYVKVAKDADMTAVMKKLEKLAAEKNSKL
ncbi:DNA replication factor Cdt1-like Protein [Gryllus bimaculatus]|nr:DNA replication factor Cdt1-like Protein [Gryllus bimaculatus]